MTNYIQALGTLIRTGQLGQTGWEQIEYHCPDCGSITPIMLGVTKCFGCGKPLLIIQTK